MDQQTNFIHCGSCAVFSAFHWGNLHRSTVILRKALGLLSGRFPTVSVWLLLGVECALRFGGYHWPFLLVTSRAFPSSSQQCVLRGRTRARLTAHLTASRMRSAQRTIVELRVTVKVDGIRAEAAGGAETVTLLCCTKRCSSHSCGSVRRARIHDWCLLVTNRYKSSLVDHTWSLPAQLEEYKVKMEANSKHERRLFVKQAKYAHYHR